MMGVMDLRRELSRLLKSAPRGGLSDMARALSVTSSAVGSWKNGTSAPTEPERLEAICLYLGLPADHLLSVLQSMPFDEGALPRWPLPGGSGEAAGRRYDSPTEITQLRAEVRQLSQDLARLASIVETMVERVEVQGDAIARIETQSPSAGAQPGS